MTTKNYPATSGYLDPEGRNWETVVLQTGKPVLDKEINLLEDIDIGSGHTALRRTMPSGWICDDYVGSSNPTSAFFTTTSLASTVKIPQGLTAHVRGWILNVSYTNNLITNQLALPAPPSGAGVKRTDIVVLEVWRRLISASPNTVGKSASGRIWQNGNVKTSPADDTTLNYVDDILDTMVGSETTKRVQIQYRLRAVSSVDLLSYPQGLDDPTIVANTVPASAGAPDGTATAFAYVNQATNGDPGLWRAGDGDPSNLLGTVDGYMYAIPLMGVFRRNSTAFNKNTNQNGGVATPGPSDRPDGLFYDIISTRDIADIRLGIRSGGWNYQEVLDKNFNALLDNTMRSEWVLTGNGGGMVGHTVLWADEIGVSNAHGGDNVVTGDTPGAAFIGEFDSSRRRFSDRPIYEIVTVVVPMPLGGWANSTFSVDFTSLAVYPYSAINWASYAPGLVVAQDIRFATFIGAPGNKTRDALRHFTQITGLGAQPISALTVTVDALVGLGITSENIYLDILVCYPPGNGLTKTPTNTYGTASYAINNPVALPASAPVSYSALTNTVIDTSHREVCLQYLTSNLVLSCAASTATSLNSSIQMPERVQAVVSILKNGTPIIGTTVVSSSGRTITLQNSADFTNPGDSLTITYTAIRALPANGEQLTIWYEARAPQTIRDALLPTSLTVEPKHIPSSIYAITCGSGSFDDGYPFPTAYVQTGGIYPTSGGTFNGEHELSARATTSVANFSASTGFLKLNTFVPFVPNPDLLTFLRSPGDADIEDRTFFKSVPSGYIPNAYGEDLSDPAKHKVVFPFLAELTANSNVGKKGELVLVLLTRWAAFDQTNGVFFNANLTLNTTTASVFRIKGNLLNRRA